MAQKKVAKTKPGTKDSEKSAKKAFRETKTSRNSIRRATRPRRREHISKAQTTEALQQRNKIENPQRPTFKHDALTDPNKELRLLRIQPDEFDADINCTIETYIRDESPAYHAISYHWGTNSSSYEIQINDQPFWVHANCLYALRQARFFQEEE